MPAGPRKFVYFIGAGASRAVGAHTVVQGGGRLAIPIQSEFWGTFLRFCSRSNRQTIERFLFRYFLGYKSLPSRLSPSDRRKLLRDVDVEEVFTFLSERRFANAASSQLRTYARQVWDALVEEVPNVFGRFRITATQKRVYRDFADKFVKRHDCVVSFNYDTIFESSFEKDKYTYLGIEDKARDLKIVKPHGSINWSISESGIKIHRSACSQAIVVAPTHLKFVVGDTQFDDPTNHSSGYLADAILPSWQAMEKEMKAAHVLVFIGYSFPVADLYFSSVLRTVLSESDGVQPMVVFVNPDAVAIEQRFSRRFSVRNSLKYFDFSQFCADSRERLLSLQN